MSIVVISATSLFQGGPLTVGREFLSALCASEAFQRGDLRVVMFCHRRDLYSEIPDHPHLQWIEKPHARSNWLIRLFFEYIYFRFWSLRRPVDLWISLQDVTPHVRARHRVVYCHNSTSFYDGPHDWLGDPRLEMFRLFYGLFYRINLTKNDYVVVQQQWLREGFEKRFGRPQATTIVAHPVRERSIEAPEHAPPDGKLVVLYPLFPRSFKNCEVLIEAMRDLRDLPVELFFTFTGNENRYARRMRAAAADLPAVRFAGFLPQPELERLYGHAHVLVFSSKLETWGLPLSEFRAHGKPIIAADLPYAREVLAGYRLSVFFDPSAPRDLARLLRRYAETGTLPYEVGRVVQAPPFASTWAELVSLLLSLITPSRAP
jgi:glycosyltransferase involved in cell wall biosynthesis